MCDETAGHVTNAGADDKIDKSDITERIKNARGWVVGLAVWVCARASRNGAAGQTYVLKDKEKEGSLVVLLTCSAVAVGRRQSS